MDDDDLYDDELARALQRRADELTGHVDLDGALVSVQQRGRVRRRRRTIMTSAGAAAAAIVLVVGLVAVLPDDRELLRAPATEPTVPPAPTTARPATTTRVTETPVPPTVSTLPPTASVATTTVPAPSVPAPTVRTFESSGGSIRVRHAADRIALDGDPVPGAGWSARVDDDGPARVRVRFERGGDRSEIRVDLVDGQLVPRITEG
jgi:hypothetical protein